jgi:hypothetical protein
MTPNPKNNAVHRHAIKKVRAQSAPPRRNIPVVKMDSVISVCGRCGRTGWVNAERICTSFRVTGNIKKPYEPRSVRCDTITDAKIDRRDRLTEGRRHR